MLRKIAPAVLSAATALFVSVSVLAGDSPNVLIILTDDQAPGSIGPYGSQVVATPNLDRLAAEGMTLDAARHMGAWTGAVCTASRTMIMTGRSVWRIPGSPAKEQLVPAEMPNHTLPAVFNGAGYDTFRTCKNGNSYPAANKRFQVSRTASKRGATPETDSPWHAEQVLAYLDEHEATQDSDPWLIYFGFSHPHDARNAPPEALARHGAVLGEPPFEANDKTPPLPVNYLPAHPFPTGHPKLRDETTVPGVGTRRDEATVRNELGKEAACIEVIDTQIGRVLDRLRASGELENTYVFFTSDHGIAVGSHGLMGKQNLYEHSWRVPMIVRGPGVAPGSRSDAMVYLGELLPTACELTGVTPPETIDTQSFAPVLLGQRETHHDTQYGVYTGGTKPGIRAVTDGRWKLIKYDVLKGSVRRTQLFDLFENPDELLDGPGPLQRDLADSAEHRAERERMEQLLAAESDRWGDPYTLRN